MAPPYVWVPRDKQQTNEELEREAARQLEVEPTDSWIRIRKRFESSHIVLARRPKSAPKHAHIVLNQDAPAPAGASSNKSSVIMYASIVRKGALYVEHAGHRKELGGDGIVAFKPDVADPDTCLTFQTATNEGYELIAYFH